MIRSRWRYRNTGSYKIVANALTYQTYQMGGPAYYTNPAGNGTVAEMQDWVTPDFRRMSKAGGVIINPMSRSENTFTSGAYSNFSGYNSNPAYWERNSGDWSYAVLGFVLPISCQPKVLVTGEEVNAGCVEASTRCLSQIGRSSSNNWENMAEIGKTLDLLRHPIASWAKFRKKNSKLLDTVGSSANAWLIYRYGITPLIRDTNAILMQLNRNIKPMYQTTHAKVTLAGSSNSTVNFTSGPHIMPYGIQKTERVTVRATSVDQASNSFFQKYGLDAKSLLTLPWELVRLSFVADWVVNVGDYLGAMVQSFQPESLGRCLSIKWEMREHRETLSHTMSPPWVITSPQRYWATAETVHKERTVGLSTAGLVVKADFRLDSAVRWADAWSLTTQQVLAVLPKISRWKRGGPVDLSFDTN